MMRRFGWKCGMNTVWAVLSVAGLLSCGEDGESTSGDGADASTSDDADGDDDAADDDGAADDDADDAPDDDVADDAPDDDVADDAPDEDVADDAPDDDDTVGDGLDGGVAADDDVDDGVTDAGGGGADDDPAELDASVAPDDPSVDAGSGNRLVRRYVVAEGGGEQFVGVVDTDHDSRCVFVPSTDDPETATCQGATVGGRIIYEDAECTDPALRVGLCAEPGSLHRTGARENVIVGEPIDDDATVYSTSGDMCVEGVSGGARTHEVELISEDVLASASIEVETLSDGLDVRYASVDGDRFLVDVQVGGEACRVFPSAQTADVGYCFPRDTRDVESFYYAESDCTGDALVLVYQDEVADGLPRYFMHTQTADGCYGLGSLREIGTEVSAASVWVEDTDGCREMPVGDLLAYSLSDPVDLDAFPRFDAMPVGEGRLRYEVRTTSSGVPVQDAGWFDTEFDVGCTPAPMSDGSIRCVPTDGAGDSSQYFADAQCSEPLLQAIDYTCVSSPATPLFVTYDTAEACEPRVAHVYETTPFMDTVFIQATVSDCVVVDDVPPDLTFYTQGAELLPEALGELAYEDR